MAIPLPIKWKAIFPIVQSLEPLFDEYKHIYPYHPLWHINYIPEHKSYHLVQEEWTIQQKNNNGEHE